MQKFHIHRFEFKYVIDSKRYHSLKEELLNYADYDEYCLSRPDRSYNVHSLYLDSSQNIAFWDKINSVYDRSKIRLRIYDSNKDNSPDVYLEIKRKKGPVILKDRAKINFCEYLQFLRAPTSLLDNQDIPVDQKKVIDEFVGRILRFGLVPKILISYKREAFLGRHHSNIRITFDSEISSAQSNDLFMHSQPFKTVLSSDVVLELKFNGSLPFWFHHLVQKYDLTRESHSKYCTSMITSYSIAV